MGPVASDIEGRLRAALAPERLVVTDDSHLHAGHAGHNGRGESHFTVEIVADAFRGKSRVERQRMVYALLAAELAGPVHALALRLKSPDEG